ncbi:hypothetical protein LTR37_004416 [Vermiconidia calcicola]|uniref:Uncharacterized protein n=1 Tax=Vermiconidia calcicola TaxID=1690605 RepID=A0ACC3NN02_9PEZI|nr:hypothetical protein LTR37_004416 [Vermiconidia calcicola]
MTACQAALGTYELLEKIIVNVPPQKIQNAKTVSKAWCTVIKDSKNISRAGVLRPIKHKSKYAEYVQARSFYGNPVYGNEVKINLHPGLWTNAKMGGGNFSAKCSLHPGTWHETAKRAEDFATMPPCCAIGVCAGFKESVRCIVYVKDGVRLRDLLEVSTALANQVLGLHGPNDKYWDWPFTIAGHYEN